MSHPKRDPKMVKRLQSQIAPRDHFNSEHFKAAVDYAIIEAVIGGDLLVEEGSISGHGPYMNILGACDEIIAGASDKPEVLRLRSVLYNQGYREDEAQREPLPMRTKKVYRLV